MWYDKTKELRAEAWLCSVVVLLRGSSISLPPTTSRPGLHLLVVEVVAALVSPSSSSIGSHTYCRWRTCRQWAVRVVDGWCVIAGLPIFSIGHMRGFWVVTVIDGEYAWREGQLHPSSYPSSSRSSQVTKGWPSPSSGLPTLSSCTAGFSGMSIPAGYKQRGRGSVHQQYKEGQHGQVRGKGENEQRRKSLFILVTHHPPPCVPPCVVSSPPPPCRVISLLPATAFACLRAPVVEVACCSLHSGRPHPHVGVREPCWRRGPAHITYKVEGHDPGLTSAHIPQWRGGAMMVVAARRVVVVTTMMAAATATVVVVSARAVVATARVVAAATMKGVVVRVKINGLNIVDLHSAVSGNHPIG
jgi:hypothetical protein